MRTEYKKDEAVTTYEEEDGCGGCKVPPHSIQCEKCYDEKTGKYKNFQPIKEYWTRK